MPNQPKADALPIHGFIPRSLKHALEQVALTNKQADRSPATLTDVLIVALDRFAQEQAPGYTSVLERPTIDPP